MILEPHTVVILNALGALVLGVGLLAVARDSLQQVRGLRRWAAGNFAFAAGWMLLGSKGTLPVLIAAIGGATLLVLALALYAHAIREFRGVPVRAPLLYAPVAATFAVMWWYGAVTQNIALRSAVIAGSSMLLTAASAHLLLFAKPRERSASHRFTGILFLLSSTVLALRMAFFFAYPESAGQNALEPNAISDPSFLAFFVIVIGLSFGFVLMCNDRYNAEVRRLALVAQRMGAAVLATGADGRIEWVNPAFEALSGRTASDLVGLEPGDVLPALRADAPVGGAIADAVTGRVPFEGEFAQDLADGSSRWYHVHIDPLVDARGALERVIALLTDVTERKANEFGLVKARDQAEAAARAKSDFLAMMSHEIRTPMNGVLGMTSLLAGTALTPEQQDYVDATRRSAQLLLGVINDILDFSKVDAGKLVIEPIPFDVHAAVADVAELLAPRAVEKGLRLTVRISPDAPRRVIGDPGRIRQVLLNLLGNAVKFTDSGFVAVVVEPVAGAAAPSLRFEVNDSGIGIAEPTLRTLFQPFVQADASTTRRFGGTGLGLSITKRLVELMGGAVGVQSTERVGSTFWFELPLPVDPSPMPQPVPAASLQGVTALVVDDVEINVRVMTEWMREWGMRVHTAADGTSALKRLREQQAAGDAVRVVVVDSLMPGIDGEKLGRAIRGDRMLEGIGLVLATSGPERGDAERFHKAGFDGYLTKPLRMDTLKGVLEIVIARTPDQQTRLPIVTRHVLLEMHNAAGRGRAVTADSVFEPATGDRAISAGSEATGGAARAAGKPLVLVVEDNIVNQIVATKLLEHLGCEVEIGKDGVEAVEKSAARRFDVVFMDMQMPRLDGLEATRRIRARGGADATMPIVAMTANAMPGDRERCIEAGMNDYVSKPITREDLADVLARVDVRR
ncbi:MAG: response regulator [Gemmatimonadetes bacterium]|nr:response regulator [Gemmatimonadota bacterium]